MAYQEVTMYRLVCDADDCTASPQDDSDYWAWGSKEGAASDAEDCGWWLDDDGRHLCDEHRPTCSACGGGLYQDRTEPDGKGGRLCEDCPPGEGQGPR